MTVKTLFDVDVHSVRRDEQVIPRSSMLTSACLDEGAAGDMFATALSHTRVVRALRALRDAEVEEEWRRCTLYGWQLEAAGVDRCQLQLDWGGYKRTREEKKAARLGRKYNLPKKLQKAFVSILADN